MADFDNAVEQLAALVPEEGEWGLVLYVDGGFRDDKKVCSWGLHGYLYDLTERKAGYGLKKCGPTSVGYAGPGISLVDIETGKSLRTCFKNPIATYPVRIVGYIDAHSNTTLAATNNQTEVMGLMAALKLILALSPTRAQILTDSQYALKGALLWLTKWKQNNYTKADGQRVDNIPFWQDLDRLMQQVDESKIPITWDWVKGHSDDLGNIAADRRAYQAQDAAENGYAEEDWSISPVQKYWNPTATIHPLLKEPRMYMLVDAPPSPISGYRYYFGNVGETDAIEGQPSADKGYSVIITNQADTVLDTVQAYFREKCLKDSGHVVKFRNDTITKAKFYTELMEHGDKYLKPRHNRLTSYHAREGRAMFGELVDRDIAHQLKENLVNLSNGLSDYLTGNRDGLGVIDITDCLFTTEIKGKKEVSKYIASIKPSLDYKCDIEQDGITYTRRLPLKFGIDLPSQNSLRALVNSNPKVTLIHWKHNELYRKYATILECDLGSGIWCGIYSNRTLLTTV